MLRVKENIENHGHGEQEELQSETIRKTEGTN